MHYKGNPWKSPICINYFDHWSPWKWVPEFNDPYKLPQNPTTKLVETQNSRKKRLKPPKNPPKTAPTIGLHWRCWALITPSSSHICIATATKHGGGTRPQLWGRRRDAGGVKGETLQGFGRWLFVGRICFDGNDGTFGEVGASILCCCFFFGAIFRICCHAKSVGLRMCNCRIRVCWQLKWVFSNFLGIFDAFRQVDFFHLRDFSPVNLVGEFHIIQSSTGRLQVDTLKTADQM